MHLGHALAAMTAHDLATQNGGEFIVRIEDIDRGRCRSEYEAAIFRDLEWLGLSWSSPVRRQSEHMEDYAAALDVLAAKELIYPCFCTRREIAAEIGQSQGAPHGPEGPLYPGTCKRLPESERKSRATTETFALRLNLARAAASIGGQLRFFEDGQGPAGELGEILATPEDLGDVVLARKDVRTSYHLAVTVDDALESISCVTRGNDLFFATHIHRLLQELLDFETPIYHHHGLVRDERGVRLATRHKAESLASLRLKGLTATDIRARLGLEAQ